TLPVASSSRVSDCFLHKSLIGHPRRRSPMQLGNSGRRLVGQLRSQQVTEQGLVAVVVGTVFDLVEEGVAARKQGQRTLGLRTGYRLAQSGPKHVDDAGLQEKLAQAGRLPVQHLCDQVLGHIPDVPREIQGSTFRVVMLVQGRGREAKPRCPPVGSVNNRLHGDLGQLDAGHPHELVGLIQREGKISHSHLEDRAGESVAVKWQDGVHPRGDHQPQQPCAPMQETFEVAGDRRRDICLAVQDHDHRSWLLQLCTRQESRHHRVDVSTVNLRRLAVDRGLAYGNTTAFQPSSEGRPESRRRLIRRLERHPGDRSLCLCAPGPGRDKHCLSSARRGTDQGQRSRDAPFKLFEQAWTFQGTLRVPWDGESLRHRIHLSGNSCPACLRLHATAALRGSKTQPRRTHTEESHPSGSRPDRSSCNSQHLCATPYKSTTRCLVGYWLTVSTGTASVRADALRALPQRVCAHLCISSLPRYAVNPEGRLVCASGACGPARPLVGPRPAAATAVTNSSYTPRSSAIQKRPAQDVKKSSRTPAATTPPIRSGS